MEIGFNSEQLIDIGLNLLGFLIAGAIFQMLVLLFRQGNRRVVSESGLKCNVASKPKNQTQNRLVRPEPEFIDLRNISRKSENRNRIVDIGENRLSPGRREIINLAERVLSAKKAEHALRSGRFHEDGKFAPTDYKLKSQGAGGLNNDI